MSNSSLATPDIVCKPHLGRSLWYSDRVFEELLNGLCWRSFTSGCILAKMERTLGRFLILAIGNTG